MVESAAATPNETEQFVERIRAERLANGQPDVITDPSVYRVLDGIMAGRDATTASADPQVGAERRRRAVARSRKRVPYP